MFTKPVESGWKIAITPKAKLKLVLLVYRLFSFCDRYAVLLLTACSFCSSAVKCTTFNSVANVLSYVKFFFTIKLSCIWPDSRNCELKRGRLSMENVDILEVKKKTRLLF